MTELDGLMETLGYVAEARHECDVLIAPLEARLVLTALRDHDAQVRALRAHLAETQESEAVWRSQAGRANIQLAHALHREAMANYVIERLKLMVGGLGNEAALRSFGHLATRPRLVEGNE